MAKVWQSTANTLHLLLRHPPFFHIATLNYEENKFPLRVLRNVNAGNAEFLLL